jgi:AAA domain-containing protein
MTLFKPTLQVRRLKVAQGGSTAFDEVFHPGVNIIRGANSSGKSTILDLIAYSLGYENVPWKQEALLCDSVFVEAEANGVSLTLQRPISDKLFNPMSVYWGSMGDAEKAPYSAWQVYPFKRSEKKESFSQILFRALEMPEVRGFAESNITMHQLLRLLYADQRSPHDTLFRPEPFDTILTRETVGGYLFGIYDDDLYGAQLQHRDTSTRLSETAAELRSIYAVLGRSGQETNFEWVGSEIKSLEAEQKSASEKLVALKNSRGSSTPSTATDPGVAGLRKSLSEAKAKLASAEDKIAKLQVDIADSEQFIIELERRIESLNESGAARGYMGAVTFSLCPCCLSPTGPSDSTVCALCKAPLGDRAATSQILRMQNELQLQRDESTRLIEGRRRELGREECHTGIEG